MDGMVGLAGCRRIVFILGSQLALLLVAMAFVLTLLSTSIGSADVSAQSFAIFTGSVLPLAIFASLYVTLNALSEPIELVLSINAKHRLNTWVLPALIIGSILAVAAFILAVFFRDGRVVSGLPTALWSAGAIEALAFAIPILALSIFAAGSVKRYLTIRKGTTAMKQSLRPLGLDKDADLSRLQSSIETEFGTAVTSVRPNPQGFTLAGLTSRPWHDPVSFSWMRAFEETFDEIRAEAEAVLSLHDERVDIYKYPGLDGDQWKAFKFATRHKPIEENLKLCPVTASLLKTVPGYPVFRDAMFSILAPGGEIAPHRDVANIYLTAHLGLHTPPGGFMEVAGSVRPWRRGEFLVFDSSYEHRAVNRGASPRVVLLIDFLHPEVSDLERTWIQNMGI